MAKDVTDIAPQAVNDLLNHKGIECWNVLEDVSVGKGSEGKKRWFSARINRDPGRPRGGPVAIESIAMFRIK